MDEGGWAVPDGPEWRLRQQDGRWYLGFAFGATCSCWVELRLLASERQAIAADPGAADRLIARVQADEPRYRSRLQP